MYSFFFFNDTATTEIYTLSLHDALPISWVGCRRRAFAALSLGLSPATAIADRKSTRLNSSHLGISYAVFCLKKKTDVVRVRDNERCNVLERLAHFHASGV